MPRRSIISASANAFSFFFEATTLSPDSLTSLLILSRKNPTCIPKYSIPFRVESHTSKRSRPVKTLVKVCLAAAAELVVLEPMGFGDLRIYNYVVDNDVEALEVFHLCKVDDSLCKSETIWRCLGAAVVNIIA
nr:hypothetical protein Iba_chr12eCG15550 [Ipomoea batatas]